MIACLALLGGSRHGITRFLKRTGGLLLRGLGNGNAPLDIDVSSLTPAMVVADVTVDPPDTRFLRDAKAQGCITIDGLGMLINQGVIGVKYWTGLDADPAAMRRKLEEIFAN
jgi:shikimate dehydrogenase